MDFRELLISAKNGDEEAIEKLFTMYRPLQVKHSFVNGKFDEDLYQELSIAFLKVIKYFNL